MKKTQTISAQTVLHVAKLANLKLTDDQVAKLQTQLGSVLGFVDKLQTLDLAKTNETSQVTKQTNIYREDTIDEARVLSQEDALANAKRKHNGYFVVDGILNE